jgi:hypothetical protein
MNKLDYFKKIEAAGHALIRHGDGSVDIWQLDVEYHNGPRCKKCDESWCHHCEDIIKPCTGSK